MSRIAAESPAANRPTGGVVGRIYTHNADRKDLVALFGDGRCVRPRTTYGELFELADATALGLLELGVEPGDRIGVASENFDLWIAVDLAILSLGAVSVPRGGDASTAEIAFCLGHAGCETAFFETATLYARVKDALPAMKAVIVMKGEAPPGTTAFEELTRRGRSRLAAGGAAELRTRRNDVADTDLATIVYTSGTTGNPKGVMLTHGNLLHNLRTLPALFAFRPGMKFVSFLPTWHTFERTVEYICLDNGLSIHYSSKRALRNDLTKVAPEFLVGVPRVWETLYQGVMSALEKLPAGKRRFVDRLLAASKRFHRMRRLADGRSAAKDGSIPRAGWFERLGLYLAMAVALPAELLARKLVYSKLTAALGGRLTIAISGGGPVPADVEEFFLRAGVPVYNGYGLTETAPVACVRTPARNVMGTIGPPLPETEVRIVGDDGRALGPKTKGIIQIRGPQVMQGYWRNEAASEACLSKDGWFDSGDVGMLAENGDVMITGRAKDTIVLRGGENVEPENIETALASSPCFLDVVVVGHAQKALGALVVPNFEVLRSRLGNLPDSTEEVLALRPEVQQCIRAEIATIVNGDRGFRTFELVTRVVCLPRPFSPEDGTLTHTMKKKRRVIEERYAALIAALFDD